MLHSVIESSLHKILNLLGGLCNYKTCLGPEHHKPLSFKFESKAPRERMSATFMFVTF